jgi:hypothetical protein
MNNGHSTTIGHPATNGHPAGNGRPAGYGRPAASDGVRLVVSIDTEEDNWNRSRNGVTVDNIQQVPPLGAFSGVWGCGRRTHDVSVARDERAVDLREACDGDAERSLHICTSEHAVAGPFVPRTPC